MYPTLSEVRAARDLRDGLSMAVPTPAVWAAFLSLPNLEINRIDTIKSDAFRADLAAAQRRIDVACLGVN